MTPTAPFRQGAGRLCLDFIRTLRYRGTPTAVEELADPTALDAWIRQFGPYDHPSHAPDPAPDPAPDDDGDGDASGPTPAPTTGSPITGDPSTGHPTTGGDTTGGGAAGDGGAAHAGAGHADAADVLAARALREAIHRLVTAARDMGPSACDPAARDLVNSAAAHPVPVPALDPAGHLRHYADAPVAAMLALLARDALDLVTSPALARVRACAGDGCGALFLDTSRPGTRRWCSMNTCGNRAKKDSLRAKTTV